MITPDIYNDQRGSFFESYNQKKWQDVIGENIIFIQDNHSTSHQNVIRGLHFQGKQPQGKLVRVLQGKIYDVAVDVRQNSSTFGQWTAHILSAENKKQIWIPEGFAHGFLTLSPQSEILYKVTTPYKREDEKTIRWDDNFLNIPWPLNGERPILSDKDANAKTCKEMLL